MPTSVMCTLAVRGAFDAAIIAAYQRSGGNVTIEWAPTAVIMQRIADGARADVVIVLSDGMDNLAARGLIMPDTRVDVCRSRYALAVAAGAPHPPVGTVAELVKTLTSARSVAFSRTGASGIYFDKLLPRLGIAEAVLAKATVIPSGFTAEKLVSGEADLAVQQMSELMAIPGIEVIGPFPDAVQEVTTVVAALMQGAADPDAAKQLLAALVAPSAGDAYAASGLEAAV